MANDLLIKLLLKDEATKQITTVEGKILHLQNTAKQLYGVFAGSAAIAGLAMFTKQAVDAAMEEEDAINRLNASLELQGVYTERLSQKYQDLALSLQRNSRFADDAVMGVMQTLITMGNIGPSSMDRVTKAVLDFATATHKDLKSSAEVIAKASEGSVTAFTKLGLKFEDNMTSAQKFERVLGFIEDRMGGAAQADVNTYAGATSQLANEWNNLLEKLGSFITQNPSVVDGIKTTTKALQDLQNILEQIRKEKEKKNPLFDMEQLQMIGTLISTAYSIPALAGSMAFKAGAGIVSAAKSANDAAAAQGSAGPGPATMEEYLQQEAVIWQEKARITIEGNEIIRSIQSQYANISKELTLQDKLFFVQNEAEHINIILKSAQIDKATQEQLHDRKTQLKLAEANLEKAIFKETLGYQIQMMNSFGQITANLAQLTGQAWLDTASIMITSFAEALKIIVEMEIVTAAVMGDWWKVAMGGAALAAIATRATVGIVNIQKQQEALNEDWTATIPAMAEGGSGVVTRPTLFLAGEAGPERFSFTPLNRMNNQTSNNQIINNNITINASIRDDRDIDALAEEISRRIARGTSR